jgi:DNA-binding response OmpR family regulator
MSVVLVADDDADVSELVSMILVDQGHEVVSTDNGNDALREVRSRRPALVLLDVAMPGGPNGFDVTRALKSDAATSHIPVLLLTARGRDVDVQEGLAAGADGYLVKPFDPAELFSRVETLLASSS